MADIFLSYDSDDRPVAELLAAKLDEGGWSVWWDQVIPVGETWSEYIKEQLDEARCVVVLWSSNSVTSGWVTKEARYAIKKGILLPARIEEVEVPFEFDEVQAANLVDWDGEESAGLKHFIDGIQRRVPPPVRDEEQSAGADLGGRRGMSQGRRTAPRSASANPEPVWADLREGSEKPSEVAGTDSKVEGAPPPAPTAEPLVERKAEKARGVGATREMEVTSEKDQARKQEEAAVRTASAGPAIEPVAESATKSRGVVPRETTPAEKSLRTNRRGRMIATIGGAVGGTIVGLAAMSAYTEWLAWGLYTGLGGGISGAIVGIHRRSIATALFVGSIGWVVVGVAGAPVGAVLGAILSVVLRRLNVSGWA